MTINVPVADFICQIIVEDGQYLKRFKKEYRYLSLPKTANWQVFLKKGDKNSPAVNTDLKQRNTTIYLPQKQLTFNHLSFLVETSIATHLLFQKILFLHASSLVINNKAYVFCGEVGAGKSTIRKLGGQYPSLSDDTTIIKKEGDEYFVYPSPFDFGKCKDIGFERVSLANIFF